jgi:hypothetical protein
MFGHRSEVGIPESVTMFDDAGLPNSNSARNDTDSNGLMDGQLDSRIPAAEPPPRFGRLALCVAAVSALAIGVMGTVAYGVWFNHDQQTYARAMDGARQALKNTTSAAMDAKAATVYSASAATVNTMGDTAANSAGTTTVTVPTTAVALAKSPAPTPPATGATPSAAPAPQMDPEQGGPLASWSGQVMERSAPVTQNATLADTASATSAAPASSSVVAARAAASVGNPPPQQVASARVGKEGRAAPQERRATYANARHKDTNLFARVGQFLRRVSYRQHGNTSRQDPYSHP